MRQVDRQALYDLLRRGEVTQMMVGATQAMPGVFPEGFGIGRRTGPRNEYLGLVMMWPEPRTLVLGLNYHDTADRRDNEDVYKIDLDTFQMTPYMRGSFEQEFPEYAGHHWAAKPYLREPRFL